MARLPALRKAGTKPRQGRPNPSSICLPLRRPLSRHSASQESPTPAREEPRRPAERTSHDGIELGSVGYDLQPSESAIATCKLSKKKARTLRRLHVGFIEVKLTDSAGAMVDSARLGR